MFKKIKNNRKLQKGFTIIEVMIVLAIAGLILVVVLIAIPQLQRNQRNTARQNDASRLATSLSSWVANNNGALPTSAAEPAIVLDIGQLSQYDLSADANFTISALPPAPYVGNTNLTLLQVRTGAQCGVSGAPAPGTARQFAVLFAVENSSGGTTGTPSCVDV